MKRRTFATKENSNQKVRIWRFALEQILNDTKRYLVPSFKHDHSVGGSDLVTKSCPTLETPWTVPARLLCPWGFSRQEYWSGLPFPSPGDLPHPGIKPEFPALQADSLPTELLKGSHLVALDLAVEYVKKKRKEKKKDRFLGLILRKFQIFLSVLGLEVVIFFMWSGSKPDLEITELV